MKKTYTLSLIMLGLSLATSAQAHQSGCHRWHSCPSDTGSYVCSDLGYACQYPTVSSGTTRPTTVTTTPKAVVAAPVSCPAHATYSPTLKGCYCATGYVVEQSACVLPHVTVPAASSTTISTTAAAGDISLSSLVELLIALNIIPSEKAAMARSVFRNSEGAGQ